MTVIFRNLMHRLKLKKFFVQGGDFGSLIGCGMATYFPEDVLGFHTNIPFIYTKETIIQLLLGSFHPEEVAEPEVVNRIYPLSKQGSYLLEESGYFHIQATKPDTIGVGLGDSPSGMIAYMLEKMSVLLRRKFVSYQDGGLTEIFSPEDIMDNFMLYWANNCMTTSVRLYAETWNTRYDATFRLLEIKSSVPVWVLQAPDGIDYIPLWLIKKKFPNLLHETLPREGGHFFTWEQPKPYAEDVVKAIVAFKKWHAMNSTLYTQCSSYITN